MAFCTITSNRSIGRCPCTDTATNNEGVSPRCPRQQPQSRNEVEAGGRLAASMWAQPPLGARRYHRASAGYRARYNRKTAIQSGWLLIARRQQQDQPSPVLYPTHSTTQTVKLSLSTFDFTSHVYEYDGQTKISEMAPPPRRRRAGSRQQRQLQVRCRRCRCHNHCCCSAAHKQVWATHSGASFSTQCRWS